MNIPLGDSLLCPKGEAIDSAALNPGDFILVKKDSFFHRLIKFGQSLRFKSQYASWTHAALVLDREGNLIEADSDGIKYTSLSDYKPSEYVYIHITATEEDRAEMVTFAKSCLSMPYDWLDVVSIGLCLLTGLRISVGFSAMNICSGFVAKALERTSVIFDIDDKSITPAMLAKWFQV